MDLKNYFGPYQRPIAGEQVRYFEQATFGPTNSAGPVDRPAWQYEVAATGKPEEPRLGVFLPNSERPSGETEYDWVQFDREGNPLLVDAKNGTPGGIYDLRKDPEWKGESIVGPEASVQVDTVRQSGTNTPIVWRVPDGAVAQALRDYFRENRIPIIVEVVP